MKEVSCQSFGHSGYMGIGSPPLTDSLLLAPALVALR